ncbi:MAG: hypothetical protein D8M57_13105 [Candidatus Scalindua sp. AMX11]|nr:MAG: hypothetical protein DWQ00_11985 [Candidatus Scalindua sp.]NOG83789.1 hypothetical protein [Planctomycetota bacterium]RZV82945.1 MAG: hypothetical protein EX341_09140 [Candidatus Scalindua sp. SCAELEC01]TDE64433.1 MAG: hypothetical protein D8M57_13105 [Candidatus Scalindua sp. AMX11]
MNQLKGLRFGRLEVLGFSHLNKHKNACWLVLCDCGKSKVVMGYCLKNGDTRSCGCISKSEDITGHRFGRLTVLGFGYRSPRREGYWRVLCSCGKMKIVRGADMKNGKIQSCGCLRSERTRIATMSHGMSKTSTYSVWVNMKRRCTDTGNAAYNNYGGRGIKVCTRWLESFENFLSDMGERPNKTSLDRINNDGNYEPANCKWATRKEQSTNKRNNINLTHNGVTLNLSQWSGLLKIPRTTLVSRYKKGWSSGEILNRETRSPFY